MKWTTIATTIFRGSRFVTPPRPSYVIRRLVSKATKVPPAHLQPFHIIYAFSCSFNFNLFISSHLYQQFIETKVREHHLLFVFFIYVHLKTSSIIFLYGYFISSWSWFHVSTSFLTFLFFPLDFISMNPSYPSVTLFSSSQGNLLATVLFKNLWFL